MKNNHKYKIAVLTDLKKSSSTVLKSTISLAKMIDASIELLHIKKPTDVVERESQLSAIRDINKKHLATELKLQKLINPLTETYQIDMSYKLAYGNVKNEIESYINEQKPDIIVLGKRQSNTFNFIGDNLIQFILEKHKGEILIAGNKGLEPEKMLSLGLLNQNQVPKNLAFANDLINHTQQPLKSFQVVKYSKQKKENELASEHKVIEYVFEKSDSVINNLSNYVSKNNINLLCVDRTTSNKATQIDSNIQEVLKKINVSVLLSGK
jgi:nucleotide-binding universal stress UspA family protein